MGDSTQLDSGPLFSAQQSYPDQPGHRGTDTSRAAAQSIAADAGHLRARCLRVLERAPATADEIARQMGASVLSIRPRVTELKMMGRIRDTGRRRKNRSGRPAAVWEIAA